MSWSWLRRLGRPISLLSNDSAFALGDSLRNLFNSAEFKLVDIGARGGAMPQLTLLAPFADYYACEPDDEEARTLAEKLKENAPWRKIIVIPEALSSHEGQAILYITKQAGLSSLMQPNHQVVNRFFSDDEFRIDSTVSLPTISLDHAAERYGFQDACFLKIDTQGTELDILQSGKRQLREALLGVYVEVEFHQFYVGQPLFADVDSYMRSLGFSLFNLHRALHRRALRRNEFYSRRQVTWAHALYLKEPDIILQADDKTALLSVSRLLGLALAFEHYDLALELMTSGKSAKLFFDVHGHQIRTDLEGFIERKTHTLLRRANSRGRWPDQRAFFFKDRENISG